MGNWLSHLEFWRPKRRRPNCLNRGRREGGGGGVYNLGTARKTFFFRHSSLKDGTNTALPHHTFDTLCFFQVLHIQPPCRHSESGRPGPVALCLLQVWSWLGKTVQIETIQGVLKKSFSELRFAKRQFWKLVVFGTPFTWHDPVHFACVRSAGGNKKRYGAINLVFNFLQVSSQLSGYSWARLHLWIITLSTLLMEEWW